MLKINLKAYKIKYKINEKPSLKSNKNCVKRKITWEDKLQQESEKWKKKVKQKWKSTNACMLKKKM